MSSNLYGRNTETLRQVIRFAVLDIPYAAVRRYMSRGTVPPAAIDGLIATAVRAALRDRIPDKIESEPASN